MGLLLLARPAAGWGTQSPLAQAWAGASSHILAAELRLTRPAELGRSGAASCLCRGLAIVAGADLRAWARLLAKAARPRARASFSSAANKTCLASRRSALASLTCFLARRAACFASFRLSLATVPALWRSRGSFRLLQGECPPVEFQFPSLCESIAVIS